MNKSKKMLSVNIVLTVLLIIALTVIVVMLVMWPRSGSNKPAKTDEITDSISDPVDTRSVEETEESEEMMDIATPYCTLKYPKKWEDNLKYTEKEENGVYTQTYYCVLNEKEIELFTVCFGAGDDIGTSIGSVLKDGEVISFNIVSADLAADPSLTDEESILIYGMAYSVNDIIKSVEAADNYLG